MFHDDAFVLIFVDADHLSPEILDQHLYSVLPVLHSLVVRVSGDANLPFCEDFFLEFFYVVRVRVFFVKCLLLLY